ncbi:MAG: riboflavin synthase [FCB group bacterium]|nr:riboflavin synthase [FCB group bacterium]
MFTGLIESIGTIKSVTPRGNYLALKVVPDTNFEHLERGDSIAVSGPCLTVTEFDNNSFTVEASQETVRLTTVGQFRPGSRVNLERALRADSRLGGHMVAGHIDYAGSVRQTQMIGQSLAIEVELPDDFLAYVVDKGSIALNGVSLTIVKVGPTSFTVNMIPETQKRTTLPDLQSGALINVEFDVVGKYILRFLDIDKKGTSLTINKLRELGF